MSTQPRNSIATQEALIAEYEALLVRSTRMLARVHEEDWESLVDDQSRYVVEVERLTKIEPGIAMDDAHSKRKASLLESILEQDMEIRRLLVERRDELGKLIGTTQRKRQAGRAYQAGNEPGVVEARSRFASRREVPSGQARPEEGEA